MDFKDSVEEKLEWYEKIINDENFEIERTCSYYYNIRIIEEKIQFLKQINCFDNIFYAVKANFNKEILISFVKNGLGLEAVSLEEINLILSIIDEVKIGNTIKILFTPNFCDVADYETIYNIQALRNDVEVTVILDNLELIKTTEIFNKKKIGIRLDLDLGSGHCKKVITQGNLSKFGVLPQDIGKDLKIFIDKEITIVGLHSHMGSGIHDYKKWITNLETLIKIKEELSKLSFNIQFLTYCLT